MSPGSSPTGGNISKDEELKALRIRNKVLTESLAAIKDAASEETKKNFDLVWFAKNRYRHPNHEASKRIDGEYQDDIAKLKRNDGDFHHGFHTGLLAASRMFKEKADILHINNYEVRLHVVALFSFVLWWMDGLYCPNRIFITRSITFCSSIKNQQELSTDLMEEAAKHSKKIKEAREQFPHTDVHNQEFPKA